MANRDAPIGFRTVGPVKSLRPYDIQSATTCYINDLMSMSDDGYVDPSSAGDTTIAGPTQNYHSTGATRVIIADDPNQILLCQDDASATLAQTNIGNLANHIAGSGSSTTLLSGHELAGSTAGAAADGFLIIDLDDRPDNEWGTWCDLLVKPYEHILGAGGQGYV